jgi:alcohol dehydrogenase (NADP+)
VTTRTAGTAAPFRPDPEGVPTELVPTVRLAGGASMPAIGLGTFGSDTYGPEQVGAAVADGLRVGYRLIDCAAVYGNEPQVGQSLGEALAGGLDRDELFVVSKVWNDHHAPADVARSVRQSLSDLRLDHLDAYLVHWPFPNHHGRGVDVSARDPHARPYEHERFMATWGAMEALVDEGLVRHLGTSNVTIPKLSMIVRDARIRPAVNEMELHPTFQQGELFQFCRDHDIQPLGYSPLGSPSRPERDRSEGDLADGEMGEVLAIAESRGIHPALVCLKWAVARGQVPIPFSVKRPQYLSSLRSVSADPLTPAELESLRGAERNNRLIKGHVFLWPGASSWLDLWDVDGTIPGWDGYRTVSPGRGDGSC